MRPEIVEISHEDHPDMKKGRGQHKRVGLVLSAGGLRGLYAHTGFMQAVQKAGIPFNCMAGCSAGAIIATCHAAGLSPDAIEQEVYKLNRSDFYHPRGWFSLLASLIFRRGQGFTGLSLVDGMVENLRRVLPVRSFSECRLPLSLIAVNLDKGEKEILQEGYLAPAAAASAAVPYFYEPVCIDGALYCDGGAYERTPKEAICCRHQLDLLIVHEIGTDELDKETRDFQHRDWPLLRLAGRLFYTWLRTPRSYGLSEEICACGCGATIITLRPELPALSRDESGKARAILHAARKQAIQHLQKIYDPASGWNQPRIAVLPRSCGQEETI